MDRFEHLAMVAFLILGFALIRIFTNMTNLITKHLLEEEYDTSTVSYYWVHSVFVFITIFTIILFWWTYYPLNDLEFWPDKNWNLWTYMLFLAVPILMFMLCEVLVPKTSEGKQLDIDLEIYYYRYHRIILGLAWLLQATLIVNLLVFFQEPWDSMKVVSRYVMLCLMAPMVFYHNRRLHETGMGIFFIGFIYIIIKYHIYS